MTPAPTIFYFGNENGTPGTILTFFPWQHVKKGHTGTGMATEIGYSVPAGSLEFWEERFKSLGVSYSQKGERFGEQYLPFTDPDGLDISLIDTGAKDSRAPWTTTEVTAATATRGFHNVTLTLDKVEPTARILTDIFGYRQIAQEGNRYRFMTDAVNEAAIVDILETPDGQPGLNAGGTNHHVAFRVANDAVQMEYREKILSKGLHITPQIDRDYFHSLYFREPGGVLFEIATDNPGFTIDEPLASLGTQLRLPKQYEPMRAQIEKRLQPLK